MFACAVEYVRPPQWSATQPFAENGEVAVVHLARKLPAVKSDLIIQNFLTLAGDMKARDLYQLSRDDDLHHALKAAVAGMRDGNQKFEAEKQLERLRQ